MSHSIDHTARESGPCAECGASGCEEAFGRLLALEYERKEPYARFHTITVSAYYLQHPTLGTEGRTVWWDLLHLYLWEGLDAVADVARRRRSANAIGGQLPEVRSVASPPLPDGVGKDVTVVDVVGTSDAPLSPDSHAERMDAWVGAITGGGGGLLKLSRTSHA